MREKDDSHPIASIAIIVAILVMIALGKLWQDSRKEVESAKEELASANRRLNDAAVQIVMTRYNSHRAYLTPMLKGPCSSEAAKGDYGLVDWIVSCPTDKGTINFGVNIRSNAEPSKSQSEARDSYLTSAFRGVSAPKEFEAEYEVDRQYWLCGYAMVGLSGKLVLTDGLVNGSGVCAFLPANAKTRLAQEWGIRR
jgi:hypothetical protein